MKTYLSYLRLKYTSQLRFYLYVNIFIALTEKSIKQEENWKIKGKIVILYRQKIPKKGEIFECTDTSAFAFLGLTPCQSMKVLALLEVFYGTLIVRKGTIFVNFCHHFVFFLQFSSQLQTVINTDQNELIALFTPFWNQYSLNILTKDNWLWSK